MAKDKTGKSGRIPKRIGGVRLPKEVRRTGEALIAKAGTPEGRRVIAAGLAMAGAALARARTSEHSAPVPPTPPTPPVPPQADAAPPAPPPPAHPAPDGMGTPAIDPAQIAEAVGQAATAFFDGLFGRKR